MWIRSCNSTVQHFPKSHLFWGKSSLFTVVGCPPRTWPSSAFQPDLPPFLLLSYSLLLNDTVFLFLQLPEKLCLFPTSGSLYLLFPVLETFFFQIVRKITSLPLQVIVKTPTLLARPSLMTAHKMAAPILWHSLSSFRYFLVLHCVGYSLMCYIFIWLLVSFKSMEIPWG